MSFATLLGPLAQSLQVLHLDFKSSDVVVDMSESRLGHRLEPSRAAIIDFGCSRRSADGSFVYELYAFFLVTLAVIDSEFCIVIYVLPKPAC